MTAAGPVGMAQCAWMTSTPALPRLVDGGPVLRFQVVGHDGDPGKLAQPAHPALGHPAVGQIGGQLQREADDLDAVESVSLWAADGARG